MPKRKGQISIETLIVFLIFLSVLGIAYAATSKIAAGSQQKISTVLSEKSFNGFSDKLSQACFLGNGNVRIAEIEGEPATISFDGAALFFSTKSFNSSVSSPCGISITASSPSNSFRIENNDGTIEIS